MRKRVPAAVLAVLLAWSLAAPALAAEEGGSEYVSQDTFWNWLSGNTSGILHTVIGYAVGSVCTQSEDGYHHSSSTLGRPVDILGQESLYYECICDACGQYFKAYETDLKQSYDDYVAELPAAGYNSDGSLLCYGKVDYVYVYGTSGGKIGCSHYSGENTFTSASVTFDCIENTIRVIPKSGNSGIYVRHMYVFFSVDFAIDGYYTSVPIAGLSGYYLSPSKGRVPFQVCHSSSKGVFYSAGDHREFALEALNFYNDLSFLSAQFYAPVYKVTPLEAINTDAGGQYNITTRPTSITGGNYGIIGDNGQITTVTNNNQIVNETNNTYYNPATGETSTITDWSYDYSDRSYNLTLEGGDTSTVTYGDENITITETTINESGDTIINNYTIYYIIEGSGSGPATHTHDWRETSVTDAACIQAGRRVYTCDVCGDTKSETISALGHNWLVLRTVNTEYDEDGALVTEGYVLYQCDRCQEQYKTTSTSSRPPPGGGTTSGSGVVLDEFPDFVDMLLEMLQQLPGLFSGFVAFLNAMFAYIPEEIIFMLTFGVAAVVLIGIIKAVRG